jgi:hypothetical protein
VVHPRRPFRIEQITESGDSRVRDRLPQDLAGFVGRSAELDRLRRALRHGEQDGGPVLISAIAGMAGVGKTQLAIHGSRGRKDPQPVRKYDVPVSSPRWSPPATIPSP